MLNIALIGAGNLGQNHVGNFGQIDGCHVTKIYDIYPEKATKMAQSSGATAITNVDEAFADDIDIVAVCTPTPSHAEYCIRAAECGKAIFCEKPLARTFEQGQAIVDAVQKAGVTMMVGHVVRFFPAYANARNTVLNGQIGNPGMIRASRINTMPSGQDGWFGDYEQSGGVTLDMIIHDFDWLRWSFGKPASIFSRSLHQHMPKMDYSLTSIRFESGAIAHVEGSWADLGQFRTEFEIAGSAGLIEFDSTENVTLNTQKRGAEEGLADVQVPSSPSESPYLIEDRAFIEAVQNDTPPPVTVEDAFASLQMALAACKSAETGEVVKL